MSKPANLPRVNHLTAIKGISSPYDGVLGLVVFDQQLERFVAIAAAQVAGLGCLLAEDETEIATVSGNRSDVYDNTAVRPAWSLLTPAVLHAHVGLSDNRIQTEEGIWVFPQIGRNEREILGEEVFVHLPHRAPARAILTATRAQFVMPAPEDSSLAAYFEDALELHALDGSGRLARRGDAGSIITTLNGDAIGTVVSAVGNCTYAAPLRPLLMDLGGCVPLNEKLVEQRNVDVTRAKRPGTAQSLGGFCAALVDDDFAREAARWVRAEASGDRGEEAAAAQLLAEVAFREEELVGG